VCVCVCVCVCVSVCVCVTQCVCAVDMCCALTETGGQEEAPRKSDIRRHQTPDPAPVPTAPSLSRENSVPSLQLKYRSRICPFATRTTGGAVNQTYYDTTNQQHT
jgi:hypothetical protein